MREEFLAGLDPYRAVLPTGLRSRYRLDLLGPDEFEIHDQPIDLADVAKVLDGNRKATLFRAAGPEKQELVGNVVASRARLARAFEVSTEKLLPEIQRRLKQGRGRTLPEILADLEKRG